MSVPADPSDEQVRAFVAERFGEGAASTLDPAGAGEWSRAFALRAAPADVDAADPAGSGCREQGLVIRFGRHRVDFAKDRAMGEHVRQPRGRAAPYALQRFGSGGRPVGTTGSAINRVPATAAPPVPRVLEIGDTPWGHYAVAERSPGNDLDGLDGAGMRAALPDLLATLGDIARLEPLGPGYGSWGVAGVAAFGTWREALLSVADERPRTAGWRARLDSRPGPATTFARALAALDRSLERLAKGWPDPAGPRRIVHGDLLNRNVLVGTGTGAAAGHGDGQDAAGRRTLHVSAVLDWGNAMYGDPLYDAAWLLFWWSWYPDWSGIDVRAALGQHLEATRSLPPDLDERLWAYQVHVGLDSLTYNAFTRRWDHLDRVADQVDALLRC